MKKRDRLTICLASALAAAVTGVLLITPAADTPLAADTSMSPISGSLDNPRRHFRLRHPAPASASELERIYDIVRGALSRAYGESGMESVANYQRWTRFNATPYLSRVHGNHYLSNYGNELAADYARFPDHGTLPAGAILAKDGFSLTTSGEILLGPLALMIKMSEGFNPVSGDWKFVQIQPNGIILGETNGENSDRVRYCIDCHIMQEKNDFLFFLPESAR